MPRDIRAKRVTSLQDLRDLINRVAPDDKHFKVVVDRMRDAPAGVSYLVIWEKGHIEEPNS